MGAGYIGVELAEAFQRKEGVTLIDVADTCLAGYYDEDLSAIMANNLQAHGIKLAFGETVREVVGKQKLRRSSRIKQVIMLIWLSLLLALDQIQALLLEKLNFSKRCFSRG